MPRLYAPPIAAWPALLFALLLLAEGKALAQIDDAFDLATSTPSASATTDDAGPLGLIPLTKGFNVSLGSTSQHDSSNGWSSILTPGLALRLNRHFSFDTGIPIYTYINVLEQKGTAAKPVYKPLTLHDALGDTHLAAHAETHALVDYNATVSLGLPTGKTTYGLGAGQVVYNINNHLEHPVGPFSPDIEIGIGDTSSLVNSRVRKSYTAVGTLAHFQAGSSVDLPRNLSFSADAYEELPLTVTTLYSTTGKGKKKVTTVMGRSAGEDNGVTTSLDIPLNPRSTLSGFYNRSFRAHTDVAGFSITLVLRPTPRPEARPQ